MSIYNKIILEIRSIAVEQGIELGYIADDVGLMDLGFDSLCLAMLVASLEDMFMVDPFANMASVVFPTTLRDFVRCYEDAMKVD